MREVISDEQERPRVLDVDGSSWPVRARIPIRRGAVAEISWVVPVRRTPCRSCAQPRLEVS